MKIENLKEIELEVQSIRDNKEPQQKTRTQELQDIQAGLENGTTFSEDEDSFLDIYFPEEKTQQFNAGLGTV